MHNLTFDPMGEIISMTEACFEFSFRDAHRATKIPKKILAHHLKMFVDEGILECFPNEFGQATFARSQNYLSGLPGFSE